MYARISTARVHRDKLGQLVEVFSRSAVPTIRRQPGNCDVILLTNAETGDASVITLWETEADLAGFEAGVYDEIVAGLAGLLTVPPNGQRFEVSCAPVGTAAVAAG